MLNSNDDKIPTPTPQDPVSLSDAELNMNGVNFQRYHSLVEMFETACRTYARQTAFINMGQSLSFQDLYNESCAFASWLQNKTTANTGDRIAIMMPNCLQYPIALFAALQTGLVVVNVNPLYTPDELKHQLNDSGATLIVIMDNFAHTLQKVIKHTALRHVVVTALGDQFTWPKATAINFTVKYLKKLIKPWDIEGAHHWTDCLHQGRRCAFKSIRGTQAQLAFLQYTGGTTGISKGAMLTHGNILANLEQINASYSALLMDGIEKNVTALPMYHIFALTVNCLYFIYKGGCNLLITNPYDITALAKTLKHYPFTAITGVNTLYSGFLNSASFMQLDFSHLKLAIAGGMATAKPVAEQWAKLTGVYILEGYGLTECSPLVSANPLAIGCHNGSIGQPVAGTSVKVLDLDHRELTKGEPGELCVKGPQVMMGYWNQPEATHQVLDNVGWLRTGDIVTIDKSGFIRLVDRKKDMIIVSGFNVYPSEVEKVLLLHDAVAEVAVIGVPCEKTGEAIKVFVVLRRPNMTAQMLIDHCRQHLTGYKVPKDYQFMDALPKSTVGKVLKRELKLLTVG